MNLQVLALNEFLELIVPVCYLFCFLVAFYGHNSHLIGQIRELFKKLIREKVRPKDKPPSDPPTLFPVLAF